MTLIELVRRIGLLLMIGGLTAASWQQWAALQRLQVPPDLTPTAQTKTALSAPAPEQPRTAGWQPPPDIFAAPDLPPPPPPPPPVEQAAIPTLVLVGTALGETSFALLRPDAGAPAARVKQGQQIGPWSIEAIRMNGIVVSANKSRWLLSLGAKPPKACRTEACAP